MFKFSGVVFDYRRSLGSPCGADTFFDLQSARLVWRTSFRLVSEYLSFASPKERTKEKATPFPLDSACAEPL